MTMAVEAAVAGGFFFETVELPPPALPAFVLADDGEANVDGGPLLLVGACFFREVLLFAMVGVGFFYELCRTAK